MSRPTPPDGTDPRVVTPGDDEEQVTVARGYSTEKRYHTATCPAVKRMSNPDTVPLSVAEWKDYEKCSRCAVLDGDASYHRPGRGTDAAGGEGETNMEVNTSACLYMRSHLLRGESLQTIGDRLDVDKSTVAWHARGECPCEHHGRELTHNGDRYVTVTGGGVPKHITGYAPIDAATCTHMRQTLVRDGVTAEALARVLDIAADTVRNHARGNCSHETGVTPAAFDAANATWVAADEVSDDAR